ncbi:hypothetical protein MsAg5_17790 [Methanosarcinaceae archaeon Ag5]|uniref:HEPN domain-containing protein n=1 Tax=Methanolapillus africanus TaxID=3028297 RepID=A0AAE4SDX0_9EURY|nr:hypothetical protein [Methanosarcinaceae archaeon Ag5]
MASSNCPKANSARRSAISRAYYSAYLQAKDFAIQKMNFVSRKKSSEHRQIADFFLLSKNPAYKEIGYYLFKLRMWRNTSDYDIPSEIDASITEKTNEAIRLADDILSKLS